MPQDSSLSLHRSLTAFSRTKSADATSPYAFIRSYKQGKVGRAVAIDQQPFLALKVAQDVLQRLTEKQAKLSTRKPRNRKPRTPWTITKSMKLPPQRPYRVY